MKSKYLNTIILLTFILSFPLFGKEDVARFTNIPIQSNVPYGNIHEVREDFQGFLWLGTENGLAKFNGIKYKHYSENETDPHSIPHNNVRKVLEDSQKRLWIGTNSGIALYDRKLDRFDRITQYKECTHDVAWMDEDKYGNIWVLTYAELIKLSPDLSQIKSYPIMNGSCFAIADNGVWVGSLLTGLHFLDFQTEEMNSMTYENHIDKQSPIRCMRYCSNKKLYIGTTDNGLFVLDIESNKMKNLSTRTNPEQIKSDYILSFFEDNDKKLWIGSVNGELLKYDLQSEEFTNTEFQFPPNTDFLTISSILKDSHDNIWIGTHLFWLYFSSRNSNSYNILKHHKDDKTTLSHNAVTCFANYGEKIIVGTDGGGLNYYTPQTNQFTHDNRFGKIILDVEEDKNGHFWMGTWGQKDLGLIEYSPQNNKIKCYVNNPNDTNSLSNNSVRNILVDDDYIWLATDGGGVCRLNIQTKFIDNKYNSHEAIFSPSNPQWVIHFMKDRKGCLWVSTSEGIYTYKENKYERIKFKNEEHLSINEIKMSFEDSKGRIWIATASKGLGLYNPEKNHIENIGKNFFIKSNINSINEDDKGNLWIVALERIIKYNHDTKDVQYFDFSKDLNQNTFTNRSMYKIGKRKFLIGSNNGLFVFSPQEEPVQNSQPKIYLSNLYIWGEEITPFDSSGILNKTIGEIDTIYLDYDKNNVSIEYFGINFDHPQLLRYKYKLDGFHSDWIDVGYETRGYFTNLAPKTYSFQVQACDINGNCSSYTKPLTIVVLPPWWKTWWFRITASSIFLLVLFLGIRERERKLRDKQVKLEKLVLERTEELRLKNSEIEKQKESLELQNKRLDKTLDTKDKILSILAHDLRNPLTSIIGNLALSREKGDGNDPQILQAEKSAHKLQEQMENLLQWARIENQTILYSPNDTFLDALTKECITLHQNHINDKAIKVTCHTSTNRSAYIDERMVGTIFRNLLNNAIKFTHKQGKISIKISENNKYIVWEIIDSGIGMSEQQMNNLFKENVTQTTFGTENEKGSGLGLKICHEFILANHGIIDIQSEVNKGTHISISFPKGESTKILENEEVAPLDNYCNEADSKDKSLLIVDDNSEILKFVCQLFQPNYNILSADNGEDALDIAIKEIPDLIISDIIMPKKNGIELCRELKHDTLTQHIPLIMLTSEDNVNSQLEGISCGADDYVAKPFNADVLKAKVATLIKNKERQRELFKNKITHSSILGIPENQEDAFIRKITEIIYKNIAETNLTVEFLADKTALSRVQLFRKFKAITGISPSEYIKGVRLDYAAEILKSGKQSIADVAYSVGFSDPKYFGQCFSDKYGMSPSLYQKKHENKEVL